MMCTSGQPCEVTCHKPTSYGTACAASMVVACSSYPCDASQFTMPSTGNNFPSGYCAVLCRPWDTDPSLNPIGGGGGATMCVPAGQCCPGKAFSAFGGLVFTERHIQKFLLCNPPCLRRYTLCYTSSNGTSNSFPHSSTCNQKLP